jgi:hypothetical protein
MASRVAEGVSWAAVAGRSGGGGEAGSVCPDGAAAGAGEGHGQGVGQADLGCVADHAGDPAFNS